MGDDILYMVEDEIAWITINQPEKMNRLTFQSMLKLVKSIERAGDDDGVKVLVITGAGDKAFCAGASLDELAQECILTSRKKLRCLCPNLPGI